MRGHGSIGGSVINDGTVAPGGSNGTLTIAGNYTQNKNGVLSIDATPAGAASPLATGGKASLDGSTVVLAQAGHWAPLANYTLLTANQGISGQFVGATSSLAFLTPVLAYSANSVNLSLRRNDSQFISVTIVTAIRGVRQPCERSGSADEFDRDVVILVAEPASEGLQALACRLSQRGCIGHVRVGFALARIGRQAGHARVASTARLHAVTSTVFGAIERVIGIDQQSL